MMVAVANAPPLHVVINVVEASRRSSSCSAVMISWAPVLPTGCPGAIARSANAAKEFRCHNTGDTPWEAGDTGGRFSQLAGNADTP